MIGPRRFAQCISFDAGRFLDAYPSDVGLMLRALVAAEDHRAWHHNGIDWFSIARAVFKYPLKRRLNGVSTIELQYLRTIVPRRGPIFLCKLKEVICVALVSGLASKEDIMLGYLWRAYYGTQLDGYRAIRDKFVPNGQSIDEVAAARISACLKYPRPRFPNKAWCARHEWRTQYVLSRMRSVGSLPTAFGFAFTSGEVGAP